MAATKKRKRRRGGGRGGGEWWWLMRGVWARDVEDEDVRAPATGRCNLAPAAAAVGGILPGASRLIAFTIQRRRADEFCGGAPCSRWSRRGRTNHRRTAGFVASAQSGEAVGSGRVGGGGAPRDSGCGGAPLTAARSGTKKTEESKNKRESRKRRRPALNEALALFAKHDGEVPLKFHPLSHHSHRHTDMPHTRSR